MKHEIVPIFVCVVLPIAIVLIISLAKMYNENKRTQIIIKAIEANKDVDTEKLIESMRKPQKSFREILSGRLLRGCIFTLLGVSLEIIGLVNTYAGGLDSDVAAVPMVFGAMSLSIGISFLIVYFKSRKDADSSDSNQEK